MSDVAITAGKPARATFDKATTLVIVAVGVIAFALMLVLGAYAPDLRSGRNGGAHALSNAGTGYSALVRLAEATGRSARVVRDLRELDGEELAVLTPEAAAVDLTDALEVRGAKATLLVLPKWETEADPETSGWVRVFGLLPEYEPENVLAPARTLDVSRRRGRGLPLVTVPEHSAAELRFRAPPVLQTVSAKGLEPVVTDHAGRIVVGKIPASSLYVLADADLLNNHGMGDPRQAQAALALLDFLNSTGARGILFDVTLNGLGASRSPLRLAFDPPFLAVTLSIVAALLLAGIQALTRFGAPRPLGRALPFGKAALIDNSAALVRKAGREQRFAPLYVDTVRERAAARLRLPLSLKGEELEERLDTMATARRFTELAAEANNARTRPELLAATRALHKWQQEIAL